MRICLPDEHWPAATVTKCPDRLANRNAFAATRLQYWTVTLDFNQELLWGDSRCQRRRRCYLSD